MTNMLENAQVSRRTFMKGSALAGLGAAAMGTGAVSLFGCSPSADGAKGNDAATQAVEETTTWGHCAINCPGRCSLKFHVQDDEVAWVETYTSKDAGFDEVQPRACLRGRTYRRWLANPDRINYPMKRVGKRGEGKFEQISWDEAVDTIASELKRIIDEYGNESVYIPYATGVSSTTARSLPRFMNCLGGFLGSYGDYSAMQMEMIVPHTYGASGFSGSTLNAAEDAALILAFGTSPTETRQGGAVSHYDWVHLRETTKGKMIYIDPRMNDSVMGRSAEWQPINPGTDAALCSAIAHELIANDQVDKEFLDAYCVGFDEDTMPESAKGQNKSYKDYIMGTGYDMVEKTAEWAAPITGIPAERIKQLAADIAAAEAPFICQGWGPQRHTNGEDTSRAICMLPVLIGKSDDGFCISFESFAYHKLGYRDEYELGPGEIVLVNPDEYRTISPAGDKMKICAFLWVYYGYPNSNYEGVNVEVMRYRNGAIMARDEAAAGGAPELDYVAGVPDSGVPHAIGYATECKTPFARPFIKYTPTWARSFMPSNQEVRNRVAKMKQIHIPELINEKKLLFVDDSIVRGTQLNETVDFLYKCGAEEVHMRSACPPIMFSCKYLSFSSSRSDMELLARRMVDQLEGEEGVQHLDEYADGSTERGKCMLKSICEQMGFDSLGYQSLDGMLEAIGIDPEKVCTYCWTGKE